MFIDPRHAISNKWITIAGCDSVKDWDDRKFLSPNAIDFTLDTLQVLKQESASLSEDRKVMRSLLDVPLSDNGWLLEPGFVYDGTSKMYVDLPNGVAAVLFTRSTLARNGVFLMCGLYDSGYKGHVGFTVYPVGGSTTIAPGTRVGQIAFIAADSAKMYAGGWNHAQGTHYTSQ